MILASFPTPIVDDEPSSKQSNSYQQKLHQELVKYRADVLKLPIISYASTGHRANINKIWKLLSGKTNMTNIAEAATLMLFRKEVPPAKNFDWQKDLKFTMGIK